MGKGNAINPLAAAICCSMGLGLLIAAGVSCSFLVVRAKDGDLLVILESSQQEARTSTSLGITCPSDFYNLENDLMWLLSRIFFFLAVGVGGLGTIVAWAICTVLLPTQSAWQFISAASAVTSVLQVPLFLMFETEPCSDYKDDQDCFLSTGCYLIVASVVCWVLVTLITQLLDPPSWVSNLDLWRVCKSPRSNRDSPSTGHLLANVERSLSTETQDSVQDSSLFSQIRRWRQRRRWAATAALTRYETMSTDGEEEAVRAVCISDPQADHGQIPDPFRGTTTERLQAQALKTFNESFDEALVSFPADTLEREERNLETEPANEPGITMNALESQAPNFLLENVNNELSSSFNTDSPEREVMNLKSERAILVGQQMLTRASEPPGTQPLNLVDNANEPSFEGTLERDKLTLGSLVSEVNGDESILDNFGFGEENQNENQDSSRNKLLDNADQVEQEKHTLKEHGFRKNAINALGLRKKTSRRRRLSKFRNSYALLDDDDIAASFPLSPPLEIITVNYESESDLLPTPSDSDKQKKDLLKNWNKLHDRDSPFDEPPSPVFLDATNPAFDDEPEPVLHFSDDSDDSDEGEEQKLLGGSLGSASDEMDPEVACLTAKSLRCRRSKTLRKKRKKKKRRKFHSGTSVASSPSLLNTVITEETVEDLELEEMMDDESSDFDPYNTRLFPLQRSRSAPNLVGFAAPPVDGSKVSEDIKMTGVNAFTQVETWRGEKVNDNKVEQKPERDQAPPKPKTSVFKQERDARGGIHAAPVDVSSDSSCEESKTSQQSHKARRARIQRLQSTHRSLSRSPSPESRRSLGDMNSMILDELDFDLVQMTRPEGVEYGPEEGSL